MTDEEKRYWLGFSRFPGIGPLRFKLLLEYFKSAERAWRASKKELVDIGLGEKLTCKFIEFRASFSFDKYLSEIKRKEISVMTIKDKEYPALLKEIPDPPFLLYVKGNIERQEVGPLDGESVKVAVVGTRMITRYGEEITRSITEGLVMAGVTIVSGMAYGVDAVAHKTAIDCGGKTIAVLGCGVDIIHPVSNINIYKEIIRKAGIVISEYPVGLMADRGTFPARNRIISGLSKGVVVTEGAEDSGALITARYAAEQGRDVFAVPGPITSIMSKAPIKLLKAGAKLVTEAEDILEELQINPKLETRNSKQIQNSKFQNLSKEERIILDLLQRESLHFDEIVRITEIPAEKLGSILTVMEINKIVKNHGGGTYGLFD